MTGSKWFACGVAALALAASAVAPVGATTLVRAGLDELVAGNGTIVVGEVVDAESYWNAEGTFILTDVKVSVLEVLKGKAQEREITITTMGGSVGDLTTLIIGGAELFPGRSYVLFLNEEDLPGKPQVRTVRDHVQGVFDVVRGETGLRAVSQALAHPLLPDVRGFVEPPGGARGLALEEMVDTVNALAAGKPVGGRPEVK